MSTILPLTFREILGWLMYVPAVVAALIGLLRFHQLQPNLRYLARLTWVVLVLEVLAAVAGAYYHNNLFLMPVYTVGELGLLALVYRETLQSAIFARAVPWLVGSFAAYALFDSLVVSSLTQFRPGQQVIQSGLVLGFVVLYFRKLLSELRVQNLEREPMFWVSIGLVVYFLGYIQIALFSDYLMRYSQGFASRVWDVERMLFIVLYTCYCVALCIRLRK